MRKGLVALAGLMCLTIISAGAQTKVADTLVIKVGEGSKIVFSIKDKKDLEILKHYNFQALIGDMITKLESNDTASAPKPSKEYLIVNTKDDETVESNDVATRDSDYNDNDDNDDDDDEWTNANNEKVVHIYQSKYRRSRRTYQSINFDIGTNNYLADGKFPSDNNDLYTVRPLWSWYFGVNSTQRTRVAGKFFVEWGAGVSWYNFKFENDNTVISKDPTGITFSTDPRDLNFTKSKLTASYINASFIPLIDFGGNRRKPMLFDNDGSSSFRIGLGPYVGYRLGSHTKTVYREDGDKKRDKNSDNFYLNNVRYGARLQFGFHDVDFFFNYDMNELFAKDKGPALNAFSFGITL